MLDGQIVGRGFNQPIGSHDPTAHAEIVAMRAAARALGNYRLVGTTMYVTIEPCLMCVGAMVHARVGTLVFGAPEPKAGAIVSSCRAHELPSLNHRIEVVGGVLEDECRAIIQEFFKRAGQAEAGLRRLRGKSGPRRTCRYNSIRPERRGTEVVVTGAPRKRLVA